MDQDASFASSGTMKQEDSGAVTLDVYPRRIVARGFVDGRSVTIKK